MVAKKTAVSGDPAPAEKATAARKTAATKAPAKKAAAKKAPAKKAAAEKAAAKKAPAKKTPAGRAAAVGKAPAQKAAATGKKTAAVDKTTAVEKRTATAKKAAAEGAAHAAKKTGVPNVVAKKSTGAARKTAAAATSGLPKTPVTAAAAAPGELAVRPGEDPWTPKEVEEARAELVSEVLRLRAELDASEVAISGLMRDSGDGAGDDQADTGTKNITRESELALAANASSMLEQTERALERLEAGTYGLCENCGRPIGKARMQAFPRATLCVDCKQKQERRH
ncbi:TraR/DksA family transcriptional regulator [Streptomyces sp. NRRL F-4474]|uniref:TraR/DksA family transcriptional regulator n=1 Tax=Streptomyces sp. NRRL F-4474 TaxID=1463851 RepID=UPI0004C5A4DF|nr:TraR/DksA family transcriptional regulator [Streptomyces sp. NRRL F-4474]